MLPQIIQEQQIFSFEFWFDGSIYQGMYHLNELYCKLQTYPVSHRSRVYQLGCRLAHGEEAIVLSVNLKTCSLWGSLRSTVTRDFLLHPEEFAMPGLEPISAPEAIPPEST